MIKYELYDMQFNLQSSFNLVCFKIKKHIVRCFYEPLSNSLGSSQIPGLTAAASDLGPRYLQSRICGCKLRD